MSLPLPDILQILRDHVSDATTIAAVTKDLQKAEAEVKQDKEANKGPKGKYGLKILIRGDDKLKALVAGGAFVLAVPEPTEGDPTPLNAYTDQNLLNRLYAACRTHNGQPKGKRGKSRRTITTLFDAIRYLKPKVIVESGSRFKIKGQTPVEIVVVTDETLPLSQ